MSTSITKQGILLADGAEIGENLLISSFTLTGKNSSYVDSNGFTVGQHNGTSAWNEAYWPLSLSASGNPLNGQVITISLDFMTTDISKIGSMFFGFGAFNGATRVNDTNIAVSSYSVIQGTMANNEWCRIAYSYTVPTSWTSTAVNLYKLQIKTNSGADGVLVYHKAIKVEKGTIATPWTPAPSDDIYVGDHGFFEGSDKGSIGKGYMDGNEFYEY